MIQRHVSERLAALSDRELTLSEAARVRAHLERCGRCREARDRYEFAAGVLHRLTPTVAPPTIWMAIEDALTTLPVETGWRTPFTERSPMTIWLRLRPAAIALVIVLTVAAASLLWQRDGSARWHVTRITAGGEVALSIGEWIETDAGSSVKLKIGTIGTVDVAPSSRMQLLTAQEDEHRLNLARGTISAQILAPPRLFFVNTPSSTVVDLGCAYTMTVDEAGVGVLRVTGGWASLEWSGRESLVPAGASCPTRPAVGPGTPSFEDASAQLKEALVAFDFENGGRQALDVVLKEARVRDTLTLWHLLSRVDAMDRVRVFDRMVGFGPLPNGVTREDALALDAATLSRWREELAWTW